MLRAYLLLLPDTHVLDLAGPLQVLSSVGELELADLEVRCVSPHPTLQTFQGIALSGLDPLPASLGRRDVVFVIGSKLGTGTIESEGWQMTVRWLSEIGGPAVQQGTRIGSVCTGAFLLGDAGLLDHRACTTHHSFQKRLRRSYPRATVVDNRLFVKDSGIWTSAGVSSGIDMALHLVAEDFGDEASIQVARENVLNFRRFRDDPGLQEQFRSRSHANQLVHSIQDAVGRHLGMSLSDPKFTSKFPISSRHLSRVFAQETGTTLKQYQLTLRLARARELLLNSRLSVEEVAHRAGFASVQAFRLQWDKREQVTPSGLRNQPR